MKSKNLIEKQMQKKKNKHLVDTIIAAKKHKEWFKIAEILSGPRKNRININLEQINKVVKENHAIVIPGKVLSQGEIIKKVKIIAFDFSERAKEKLIKAGCEISSIADEIKKNPGAKGVRILKDK